MKITQNEKGQTQYHLEKINDLLIIPEDVWDRNGGWDTFKMAINSMRLMLSVNEADGRFQLAKARIDRSERPVGAI